MILSLIAAASQNNVIGKDNTLPWNLPDDLQYFRSVTEGSPIIMGRKNHESIGRVLPGRRNIVVTRQPDLAIEGCDVANSLDDAIEIARQDDPEEVFVIGGGEIYALALPLCDRIYLTRVHADIDGDVFFPEVNWSAWKEVQREEHEKDADHAYDFTVLVYEK